MDFDTLSYSISAENITLRSSINKITKNFNCAIESFKGSKPHHAAMLVDYYSHVGIYIQDRKNVVIVFGYDKKYSDMYYPRKITYPITHQIIINNTMKKVDKNTIIIDGKNYILDGKNPILVFRENGSAFYLYPPYKTNEKIHMQ
jgi:hypothetical protein